MVKKTLGPGMDEKTLLDLKKRKEIDFSNRSRILSKELRQVLESGEPADLKLVFDNNVYIRCHKDLICSKSPVFKRWIEATNANKLRMDDEFSKEIVEGMLNFVYSETLFGFETSEMEHQFNLFLIAQKYEMDAMKDKCEKALAKELSIDNAVEILVFAEEHNVQHLKEAAIKFTNENKDEVIASGKFDTLISAEVLFDLYKNCRHVTEVKEYHGKHKHKEKVQEKIEKVENSTE